MNTSMLDIALQEGEGLKIEFKERPSNLGREIVAFANTVGGTIYLGINDDNNIIGIELSNKLKSQVTTIARECDPSIQIKLESFRKEKVLAIHVEEGSDKPYRCKEGFYIRSGPNSQKLRRDEIVELIHQNKNHYFDEKYNEEFCFPEDFSQEKLDNYVRSAGIQANTSPENLLISLGVAKSSKDKIMLNNAGVLFFAKTPKKNFREAFITCVRYKTHDRFSIIDKQDIDGSPIEQIEHALQFVLRHMAVETYISSTPNEVTKHKDIYEFSVLAVREAIINAVTHRDYFYGNSHIYIHMYPDKIDFENPGGLIGGLTIEDLGQRSIRRNPLIADLLYRAGYIERVGSGFDRMRLALETNNNPPLEVSATNFFNLRFYKRVADIKTTDLTPRQLQLLRVIQEKKVITKKEAAQALDVSDDTALRELKILIKHKLIEQFGIGKATTYRV